MVLLAKVSGRVGVAGISSDFSQPNH